MSKFKELVLLRDEAGVTMLAIMPTGTAHPSDVALISDEILLTVEAVEWIAEDSGVLDIIRQACDIVEIETLFKVVWDKKEEETDAAY